MHLPPLLLFSLPFTRARGVGRYRLTNASTASAPTAAPTTSDASFGILTCILPLPTTVSMADPQPPDASLSSDDVWWSTAASDATTWYSSVAWTPTAGPGGPAPWSFTSSRSRGRPPHSSLSTQDFCATETEFYTTTETETETSTSLTWYTWTETSTSYSYVYDTVCQNGGGVTRSTATSNGGDDGPWWTWASRTTDTDSYYPHFSFSDSDRVWTWTWPPEIPTDTQVSSFWTPTTATSELGPVVPTGSGTAPSTRRPSSSPSTHWFSWDLTGSATIWPLPTTSNVLSPDGATETDSSSSDGVTETESLLPAWVTESKSSYDRATESSANSITEQPMWRGTTRRHHHVMGGTALEPAAAAAPLPQRRDVSSPPPPPPPPSSPPPPTMVVVTVTVTKPVQPSSSSSWAAASSSRRCDDSFCSNGNLWCVYWAGYTSWDVSKGPMPGEAHTIIGSC